MLSSSDSLCLCGERGETSTRLARRLLIGLLTLTGASCGYLAHPPAAPGTIAPAPANITIAAIRDDAGHDGAGYDDDGQAAEPDDSFAPDDHVDGFARVSIRPQNGAAAPSDGRARTGAPLDDRALELRIFALVNRERRTHGLGPLEFSPALARAALKHSRAMAKLDFFDHQGHGEPALFVRVADAGESADHVGENLYESTGAATDGLAEECVRMWMWSTGHRSVLLEPAFVKTGIAIGRSVDGRNYVTEDFAY
ncbi:MAG: CAP domain-containing protein [Candidatus Binatales bacterium]